MMRAHSNWVTDVGTLVILLVNADRSCLAFSSNSSLSNIADSRTKFLAAMELPDGSAPS